MERYTERLCRDFRFRFFAGGTAPDEVYQPDFDDRGWESVRVPHDWAAGGTFERENDLSYMSIMQDGILKPIEHTGRTGALPTVGLGVYRKWIRTEQADAGKKVSLEFDGVMWEAHVYVNGQHVFFNHFGYKSFSVDITDYIVPGENALIAVSAAVYEDCSRWYSGAGIYRNMYLVKKAPVHIAYNGIWIRQLEKARDTASLLITVDHTGDESVQFSAEVYSPSGQVAASVSHGVAFGELSDIFTITRPELWDIDAPNRYTAVVTLLDKDGQVLDNETVKFGVRTIRFCAEEGFFLNGRRVKLNGVCNHHDLGSLGSAMNVSALKRQLKIMREMGVNAIRTSHNPPAPELLELCDEMGFVVMDEFFDEWLSPKIKSGYANYFLEHAEQDVEDIIRRDRNHPCVVLWSIGNEIPEQGEKEGWRVAKLLSDAVYRNDPTRPVTAGFDYPLGAFEHHLTDFVDVVGFNYKPHMYRQLHDAHPSVPVVGTETASCISTRGVYKLPAQRQIPVEKQEDLTVSAYELSAPGWAYYAEREWAAQDDCPYMSGEFVWTGMDYLGEPTPYYSEWPSRSSYFGIVDLAGLPKNRFYGYKAKWTEEPVLHMFPHWNWEGMEGKVVPVHVYSSYPAVELFINGVSQGRKDFSSTDEVARYRLMWNDTVYEPGTVLAVAYDASGREAARTKVCTAGAPARIELRAETDRISADGEELVYCIATIVDEAGNVCPFADNRLTFAVEGAGELLTTDAGDQRETESFARADKKALAGHLVACVRAADVPGEIRISVAGDALEGSSVTVSAL